MDAFGLLLFCLLAVALLVVASCLLRANRLDRLHVRTDAAKAALLAALERRAMVARALARELGDEQLLGAARRTERVPPPERETAENELSRLLGALSEQDMPADLHGELADAQQRVMLARRVHNDAVRDTRALRSRRLVRWLRLAGKAPAPSYFEIVDADAGGDDSTVVPPRRRRAGRVLLLDSAGRVLLFEGIDPARPQESFWFTPGGGVESGEDCRTAARRELAEETGLELPAAELVGPVWRRHVVFSFDGRNFAAEEEFFLAHADLGRIDTSGFSDLEADVVLGHHWWTDEELRGTGAVIFPRQLGDLLGGLRASHWDGVTRVVS
ncbi:NUDIX hydrolase [Pseudonocardia sp. Cha107L01]|uniref:NUDIX hydrolase n=1 Tax=Pseudonocardia sp. Cha107L01 TaxID=3457576 RepID=UPI00403E4BFB